MAQALARKRLFVPAKVPVAFAMAAVAFAKGGPKDGKMRRWADIDSDSDSDSDLNESPADVGAESIKIFTRRRRRRRPKQDPQTQSLLSVERAADVVADAARDARRRTKQAFRHASRDARRVNDANAAALGARDCATKTVAAPVTEAPSTTCAADSDPSYEEQFAELKRRGLEQALDYATAKTEAALLHKQRCANKLNVAGRNCSRAHRNNWNQWYVQQAVHAQALAFKKLNDACHALQKAQKAEAWVALQSAQAKEPTAQCFAAALSAFKTVFAQCDKSDLRKTRGSSTGSCSTRSGSTGSCSSRGFSPAGFRAGWSQ